MLGGLFVTLAPEAGDAPALGLKLVLSSLSGSVSLSKHGMHQYWCLYAIIDHIVPSADLASLPHISQYSGTRGFSFTTIRLLRRAIYITDKLIQTHTATSGQKSYFENLTNGVKVLSYLSPTGRLAKCLRVPHSPAGSYR